MRRKFHEMMGEDATGIVERRTDRSVLAVLADTDPKKRLRPTVHP
jgi:hypothetical protein